MDLYSITELNLLQMDIDIGVFVQLRTETVDSQLDSRHLLLILTILHIKNNEAVEEINDEDETERKALTQRIEIEDSLMTCMNELLLHMLVLIYLRRNNHKLRRIKYQLTNSVSSLIDSVTSLTRSHLIVMSWNVELVNVYQVQLGSQIGERFRVQGFSKEILLLFL